VPTPVTHLYPSPLRYPGGKGKVANFLKLVMLRNDLVGSEYVEPYAGGASVALSLLFEEYASRIHINDLNRSVYAFWKAVLDDTDELCARIESTRATTAEWRRQRAVQEEKSPERVDLAFSTFFLNRTSRSGILTGGIIGGYAQKGEWKIDARWRPEDLVRRIERVARFRNRITLTRIDTAKYLRNRLSKIERPFLYLDPPYYVKGWKLYENFYDHEDHEEISKIVKGLSVPWVVSYDAAPKVVRMYSGFERIYYHLTYSAGARQEGREVMFFSDEVRPPRVPSAAEVYIDTVADARLAALG
jgi:DNA adenine methylase